MTAAGKLAYNPALDGVRGLAVLAVLCFHADWPWARGGFLGVSAFFTLSGFLITRLLLGEWMAAGRIDLRHFWRRRLRRLMPAALIGLLGIVAGALVIAAPSDPRQLAGDVLGSLAYVANWRFIATGQDYAAIFREPSPVQHFWSLGIEEQFYLFYPLAMLALLRTGVDPRRGLSGVLGLAVLVSTALAALLYVPGAPIARAYYGTDTRVAELLVGGLLALWLPGDCERLRAGVGLTLLGAASLLGILASWAVADTAAPALYHGGLFAHALAVACLLGVISAPGPLRRLLSLAPLRWIGWISYGIYVYHWPIYLWLDAEHTGLSPLPLFGLRLLVTLAVATVSYAALEQPVRRGRSLPGRSAAVAAIGCVVTLLALLGLGRMQWSEAGVWATAVAVSEDEVEHPLGDDLPGVLVVGDSLAQNVGRGLAAWGRRTGLARFAARGVQGCPVALGGEVLQRAGPVRQEEKVCRGRLREWRAFVDAHEPDAVVVLTGGLDLFDRRLDRWDRFLAPGDAALDDWLVAQYTELARSLTAGGAELVWLTWPCATPQQGAGPFADTRALEISRVRHLNERLLPKVRSALADEMHIVDLFEPLCPNGEFTRAAGPIANGRPDGLHLSRAGAHWLAGWLGPRILLETGLLSEEAVEPDL